MPIYEYECQTCKKVNEFVHKIADPEPTECSHCHKGPLTRLVSKTSFQLKGTGWYATDYPKSGQTQEKSSSSEAAKATSTPPKETKSEVSTAVSGPATPKPAGKKEG